MPQFKRLTVVLILFFLAFSYVALQHHHDSAAIDQECSICDTISHLQATGQSPVAFDGVPFTVETVNVIPASALTGQIVIAILNNRAPPA